MALSPDEVGKNIVLSPNETISFEFYTKVISRKLSELPRGKAVYEFEIGNTKENPVITWRVKNVLRNAYIKEGWNTFEIRTMHMEPRRGTNNYSSRAYTFYYARLTAG